MAINIPIMTRGYYSQSIERWKPDTSESKKVRDLGNNIKMIKAETQFIKDNGFKPSTSIDFTKRLNNF